MVPFYRQEYGCPDLSELGGLLTQAIGASINGGFIDTVACFVHVFSWLIDVGLLLPFATAALVERISKTRHVFLEM
jgi:hypothetical protein